LLLQIGPLFTRAWLISFRIRLAHLPPGPS
jgi:hypothetical protein